MLVAVGDPTQQVLLLLDTGVRRLPVEVVRTVGFPGKNWVPPSTVG